jgi:hypothetical protein
VFHEPDESTVTPDGLDRAILERAQACGLFGGIGRLLRNITMAPHFVPAEIAGCRLSAEIAVDACGVDIKSAGDVLRHFH